MCFTNKLPCLYCKTVWFVLREKVRRLVSEILSCSFLPPKVMLFSLFFSHRFRFYCASHLLSRFIFTFCQVSRICDYLPCPNTLNLLFHCLPLRSVFSLCLPSFLCQLFFALVWELPAFGSLVVRFGVSSCAFRPLISLLTSLFACRFWYLCLCDWTPMYQPVSD